MVGLIPNLLLKLVEANGGAAAVAAVKDRAEIPSERTYPFTCFCEEEEWQRLFAASCDVLQLSRDEAEQVFASFFCQDVLVRWPAWFEMASGAREFLLRQPEIHNSFRTSLSDPAQRDAVSQKFHISEADGELVTRYSSPNGLCAFYKSAALWIIDHYGERATIEEPLCTKRGDDYCEIHIRWPQNGETR